MPSLRGLTRPQEYGAMAEQMPGNCARKIGRPALRKRKAVSLGHARVARPLHTRAMEGRRWRTFKIERGSDRMRSTILRAVLDPGGASSKAPSCSVARPMSASGSRAKESSMNELSEARR